MCCLHLNGILSTLTPRDGTHFIADSHPLGRHACAVFCVILGVLYGALCIGMAAVASLMGALLQVRAQSEAGVAIIKLLV